MYPHVRLSVSLLLSLCIILSHYVHYDLFYYPFCLFNCLSFSFHPLFFPKLSDHLSLNLVLSFKMNQFVSAYIQCPICDDYFLSFFVIHICPSSYQSTLMFCQWTCHIFDIVRTLLNYSFIKICVFFIFKLVHLFCFLYLFVSFFYNNSYSYINI